MGALITIGGPAAFLLRSRETVTRLEGMYIMKRTRVRIVNHITGNTKTVETLRDAYAVAVDLMRLAKKVNRRRDRTVKASVQLLPDLIVLQWHCPCFESFAGELAKELIDTAEPIHEADDFIWKGGHRA